MIKKVFIHIFIQQPPSTTPTFNKSDERRERNNEEAKGASYMHSTLPSSSSLDDQLTFDM